MTIQANKTPSWTKQANMDHELIVMEEAKQEEWDKTPNV